MLLSGNYAYGTGEVSRQQAEKLRKLSISLQGWISWEESGEAVYIPAETWVKMVEAKRD